VKAKDLAAKLLKNPEAEVVFDDTVTEYIYSVEIQDATKKSVCLTWDLDKQWIRHDDGKLVTP
jgi:hypothetical protein